MKKRYLILAGIMAIWLIALALVAKASVDRLQAPAWGNPSGDELSPELAGDTHVGQQFVAPLPGLQRIEVALFPATTGGAKQIVFHLKTDPAATEDLWTSVFEADELQDGEFFVFEFPEMRDSKGKTYYFYLESADSLPGDAVAVYFSPQDFLEGASAYLNEEPAMGNLKFRTGYSLRTREKIELLLSRMTESRPYLVGSRWFYIGLVVAYVLVLGAFLFLIAKIIVEEQEKTA